MNPPRNRAANGDGAYGSFLPYRQAFMLISEKFMGTRLSCNQEFPHESGCTNDDGGDKCPS